MVDGDLALEAVRQQPAALVVKSAPPHVDRLDLRRRRRLDRLVVAFTDQEVVLDDPPERRDRKDVRDQRLVVLVRNIEDKPVIEPPQQQLVGTVITTFKPEAVVVEQVIDRDLALVPRIGVRSARQ